MSETHEPPVWCSRCDAEITVSGLMVPTNERDDELDLPVVEIVCHECWGKTGDTERSDP